MALARTAFMAAGIADASSHREAPNITRLPTLDSTDFYIFNSYEEGRGDFVTMIANYMPPPDAYGGPNYFAMDPEATYSIHIDNDGDATEDLTFAFNFTKSLPSVKFIQIKESIMINKRISKVAIAITAFMAAGIADA